MVIAVIGLSLMGVGINWAAGGVGNPDYGNPVYLLLSLVVLSLILLINKFARGFIANISVLLGIVAGFVIAVLLGRVNMDGVAHAPWVGIVLPFHFGMPHFDPLSIATMVIVMFVTFIESTGMFLAVGDLVERPVDQKALVRGLRVDGLGTLIGGIFNSFSAYVVLAKPRSDRPDGRDGRVQPLRLRNRRRDPRRARPVSENGAGGGVGSAVRARRRAHRHVRHDRGERHQDAIARGLHEEPSPTYSSSRSASVWGWFRSWH